jgi:hypothetical protein
MNVSTLWRFLGLVPILVAWLFITPIARADDRLNFNLDWGWAVKELSRMQSAVDRLDAGARKANPDEYKGELYFDFYNEVRDMQLNEENGFFAATSEDYKWCLDARYPSAWMHAGCQYKYDSVISEIKIAYELLEQYSLWMSSYYFFRDTLSTYNSDILRDQRAGNLRARALRIIQNQRQYIANNP